MRLSEIIPPHFYDVADSFFHDTHSQYWLAGGRGSIKSSIASELIILGMLRDPQAHAVFARRYKVDLHHTIYAQVKKAITILGLESEFKVSTTDYGAPPITRISTGQKLIFVGLDDPDGVKSISAPFGYIKYSMFEEIQEFDGLDKLRSATQSIRRGANINFQTFYCYNPPRSKNNWTYESMLDMKQRKDTLVSHSNWEMLPDELAYKWLGRSWIEDALALKESDRDKYDHEYMGIPVGYGTDVFHNLEIKEITSDEIKSFDNVAGGLDWGFARDPNAYTRSHFDKRRRILYIFDEYVQNGIGNRQQASIIAGKTRRNPLELTVADSAEPKSNAELIELGLNVIPAKKGNGSVEAGTKWLQELNAIIIDPVRCPVATHEFTTAEYELNRNGEVLPRVKDVNNHTIDSIRYRCELEQQTTWGWS